MTLPDVFKDVNANFVFADMAAISFCKMSLHNNTHIDMLIMDILKLLPNNKQKT